MVNDFQERTGRRIFLPERKVSIDGTNYYIHGLVHGNPWIKISTSFKEGVNRQLKDFNVLCEDGFTSWISGAVSMNETEYFNLGKSSFFEMVRFLSSLAYFCFSSSNKKQELEIFSKVRKMASIEDLIEIRNELFKEYLPEPEGMNFLMRKKNCGRIDFPKGNIPLRIRRYIYESKIALDHTKKNNLKELHLVVGCAHELPLEYLLNNINILDKYSL